MAPRGLLNKEQALWQKHQDAPFLSGCTMLSSFLSQLLHRLRTSMTVALGRRFAIPRTSHSLPFIYPWLCTCHPSAWNTHPNLTKLVKHFRFRMEYLYRQIYVLFSHSHLLEIYQLDETHTNTKTLTY